MILCICHSVSEREVDDLVRRGAGTPALIAQQCGAGSDCGACINAIEKICSRTGARCTGPGAHDHDDHASKAAATGA